MCDLWFHLSPWAGGVMTSPHLAQLHPSRDRLVPPCLGWSLGEQLVPRPHPATHVLAGRRLGLQLLKLTLKTARSRAHA